VKGYFPKVTEKVLFPGSAKYDFAFVDGDHSFDAVVNDLLRLRELLNSDAYVLLHDAFNAGISMAIQQGIKTFGYWDCGRIGRVMNNLCGDKVYGGFHLLLNK
jgi:hypothetical protein